MEQKRHVSHQPERVSQGRRQPLHCGAEQENRGCQRTLSEGGAGGRELRGERDRAQQDGEQLRQELEQANKRLESLQSGNDVLMEKARKHFEDEARAAKEEDELRQRAAELEARIPELEQRAGRYEKEALSIAQTLIGAREESERIVAAARDNARLVQEQLRQEVARVAGALDRMTADYVEIREGTQRYGEQLRVMMQTLFDELELTKGHLNAIEITPIGQEEQEGETGTQQAL